MQGQAWQIEAHERTPPGGLTARHVSIVFSSRRRHGRCLSDWSSDVCSSDLKSLPVMIVNQEFVRRFLANRNPIGGKVNGWGKWFTVVGVAKDIKYHTLTESPQPYFYIPIRQIYRPEMGVTFYV